MASSVQEYPRPDFARSDLNWKSLNGPWSFLYDDDDSGILDGWHLRGLPEQIAVTAGQNSGAGKTLQKLEITVPYVFQTPASGIGEREPHEVIWYERLVDDIRTPPELKKHFRLLLRFGAVDYEATIWLDGQYVGEHRGGHVPFDLDLSEFIKAQQQSARLTIRDRDSPYDLTQPRGKQYWAGRPRGIRYTPSSGIWQSVWLGGVPRAGIADSSGGTVLRSNGIYGGLLHATISLVGRRAGRKYHVKLQISIGGVTVDKTSQISIPQHSNVVDCALDGVALWSPDHPLLYDVVLSLFDGGGTLLDEVQTKIGMRELNWTTGDHTFRLNGHPIFQALSMGFNGCRKHQKVEDPRFLYFADQLGFLVWGEMANGYEFNNAYMDRFNEEWMAAVKRDINHPSIVTWTPINESWGYPELKDNVQQQNHIRSVYYMTKCLDPTRSVNDNCGWEHVCDDLTTFHDYSDGPALTTICKTVEGILDKKGGRHTFVGGSRHRKGAPIMCTEFGGVNIAPSDPNAKSDGDWGYTTASDPADLLARLEKLLMGVVGGGHCCGFVYTQIVDVEQEVNGLYTFDRKAKLKPELVEDINRRAKKLYLESVDPKGLSRHLRTFKHMVQGKV
ncbi:beta-galactosidase/beta-glucuronidase [Histoplasma capsulatum var. duboisii H88]|uniref:Beta-galactosidase/beta-glucuronidase n=1 Tax=Ajellomyces capsulatus (strain H88) TaxID=544711 RepID=F0UM67_AJEC8|nr:beta-galactosidase/beta-glucuronidase [Histoplasma capsulatum var. duboisii H88]